jgi:hypothetical protein
VHLHGDAQRLGGFLGLDQQPVAGGVALIGEQRALNAPVITAALALDEVDGAAEIA